MRAIKDWPPSVVVRGAWYGCETGCDGFEVATDDDEEKQLGFHFFEVESEAEAREIWEIPANIVVRFVPGRLDP